MGFDGFFLGIDPSDVEISRELDVLLRGKFSKLLRCDRLGEDAGQGRNQFYIHFVSNAVLLEKPIRHEDELDRGDRAFEGEFRDIEHNPSGAKILQLLLELLQNWRLKWQS